MLPDDRPTFAAVLLAPMHQQPTPQSAKSPPATHPLVAGGHPFSVLERIHRPDERIGKR